MAFVRWRGNCAQLLTTIYEQGRSRQIRLAVLRHHYVSEEERSLVQRDFPQIQIDWQAVDAALAKGPPVSAAQVPPEHLDWADVEYHLRAWAERARPQWPRDADRLDQAAEVLTWWRAGRPFFHLPAAGGEADQKSDPTL